MKKLWAVFSLFIAFLSFSLAESLVVVKQGNLRATPSTKGDVIGKLTVGTKVEKLEVSSGWVKIKLPDEKTGWAHESLVKIAQNEVTAKNAEMAAPKEDLKKTLLNTAASAVMKMYLSVLRDEYEESGQISATDATPIRITFSNPKEAEAKHIPQETASVNVADHAVSIKAALWTARLFLKHERGGSSLDPGIRIMNRGAVAERKSDRGSYTVYEQGPGGVYISAKSGKQFIMSGELYFAGDLTLDGKSITFTSGGIILKTDEGEISFSEGTTCLLDEESLTFRNNGWVKCALPQQ